MRVGTRTVHSMVLSVAIFVVVAAAPATVAASVQADFGSHVANCAQTHGFDGDHNPGMHQGRSGWSSTNC